MSGNVSRGAALGLMRDRVKKPTLSAGQRMGYHRSKGFGGRPMTEAEWLACEDPCVLFNCIARRSNIRKIRLVLCSVIPTGRASPLNQSFPNNWLENVFILSIWRFHLKLPSNQSDTGKSQPFAPW